MQQLPFWATTAISLGNLIGAAVTAVATFFLWRVTRVLARETERMANMSVRPHVVATVIPNRWAMQFVDLHVDNTGNATAYDIKVKFDPPLELADAFGSEGLPPPLQQISVLKPGQGMSSYLAEFSSLKEKRFQVAVSWRTDPDKETREVNAYTLSMADHDGVSQLGTDPMVEIANQLKRAQEDWSPIAKGENRLNVDAFTMDDRIREREAAHGRIARYREQRNEQEAGNAAQPKSHPEQL
jgi:hypothetical protein